MSSEVEQFRMQLDVFRRDVEAGTQSLFAYLAINDIAARRQIVHRAINETPLLWMTILASLQNDHLILLGRIFDKSTQHSAYKLLDFAKTHPHIFTRDALAHRKVPGSSIIPPEIVEYVAKAYIPNNSDFSRLQSYLDKRGDVYKRKFQPIRSKVVAHRVMSDQKQIETLYAKAKYSEVIDIYIFLHRLYECLWELLENGRKPILRRQPYSVRRIHATAQKHPWRSGKVQEIIVKESRKLMSAIEKGTNYKKF